MSGQKFYNAFLCAAALRGPSENPTQLCFQRGMAQAFFFEAGSTCLLRPTEQLKLSGSALALSGRNQHPELAVVDERAELTVISKAERAEPLLSAFEGEIVVFCQHRIK